MIIVSLVLLSICLLQVSHAVPYPVWRAAADYLFLRAKGGFPAGMIMGQETLAASCPFSLYIYKVFVKIKIRSSSKVLFVCLTYEIQANAMARPKSQVGPDGPFWLVNMCRETRKNDLVLPSGLGSTKCERYYPQWK